MGVKKVFSGIQPTGNLHIGNYFGAIKQWVEKQNTSGLFIYCIVDMHAITVEHNPNELRERTMDTAALLLAMGIDPKKSLLFVQSQNLDHANLAWVLNCNISFGQMSRMTQFKEKSERQDFVSVGLFDYPALMAADILLYGTTEVPVGDDQKQHVELARDVAERFNNRYGDTFVLPEPIITKTGARIMSLTDPNKKMSKSDENPNSRIEILDSDDEIRRKIALAVTDSGSEVRYDPGNKPGISNLMDIYSLTVEKSIEEIEKEFAGRGYGDFKSVVADALVELLAPFRERYNSLRESPELKDVLREGADKAREISGKKLKEVYDRLGFVK